MTTFQRNLFTLPHSRPIQKNYFSSIKRNKNTNWVKYYSTPSKEFKYRQSMYPSSIHTLRMFRMFRNNPILIPSSGRVEVDGFWKVWGRGVGWEFLWEWGGGGGSVFKRKTRKCCNGCLCKRVIISSFWADCGLCRVGRPEFCLLPIVDWTSGIPKSCT